MKNVILQGDALNRLKDIPDKSVDMCMTSPPYWALRDYGVDGQLGLEPTFDKYIKQLCDIFDGVKNVLKDEGTCWVNLGDTYYGGGFGKSTDLSKTKQGTNRGTAGLEARDKLRNIRKNLDKSIPTKSLTMIPMRFAIEMVNRGWILRNTIIWRKPNCMPSSAKDRFTVDFEYIFLFSKKKKYYFKQQFDDLAESSKKRLCQDIKNQKGSTRANAGAKTNGNMKAVCSHKNLEYNGQTNNGMHERRRLGMEDVQYLKRNMRTTWDICPKGFKEAHFAIYPEALCDTPLKAGCPVGGVILDPFFGSGTTGVVALKQKKNYIGIELNPEYIKIAEKRLEVATSFLKKPNDSNHEASDEKVHKSTIQSEGSPHGSLNLKSKNSHQNKNIESSNPIGSSAKTNRDTNGITGSGDNYSHNLNKEKKK